MAERRGSGRVAGQATGSERQEQTGEGKRERGSHGWLRMEEEAGEQDQICTVSSNEPTAQGPPEVPPRRSACILLLCSIWSATPVPLAAQAVEEGLVIRQPVLRQPAR